MPFASLGTTKARLKRFFAEEWGRSDYEALADAVGPGDGQCQERLDHDLALKLRVGGRPFAGPHRRTRCEYRPTQEVRHRRPEAATFEGDIVPEATRNPRTLVFSTGPVSDAASREYRFARDTDDHRVVRLFEVPPDLISVLVAQDFVALSLRHDRWADLLAPALATVNEEFSAAAAVPSAPTGPGMAAMHAGAPAPVARGRRDTRLDRAWREWAIFGQPSLRTRSASWGHRRGPTPPSAQVAAVLLLDCARGPCPGRPIPAGGRPQPDGAAGSRGRHGGRRPGGAAPVAGDPLSDADAWVRWKVLRGLGRTRRRAQPHR